MAKGDGFYTRLRKRKAVNEAEASSVVADTLAVRGELMEKVQAGTLTLEDAQKQLRKIKRDAKKNGLVTRNQAFIRG